MKKAPSETTPRKLLSLYPLKFEEVMNAVVQIVPEQQENRLANLKPKKKAKKENHA